MTKTHNIKENNHDDRAWHEHLNNGPNYRNTKMLASLEYPYYTNSMVEMSSTQEKKMTTQQQIDLNTARAAAAEAGLECTIEAAGDDYTITLETGEVETVTGLPGALRVIQAYAALA